MNHPDPEQHSKTMKRDHPPNIGSILSRHLDLNLSESGKNIVDEPTKLNPESSLLRFLKPIPFVLLTLFLFSFYWDFDGVNTVVFGYELSFGGILKIISVSGMIGYLTNWIAITMLFRPLKKRPLLGQGLIPAQKERIAYRLARAVSEDLINPELIKRKIDESKIIPTYRKEILRGVSDSLQKELFRDEFKQWIVQYVNSVVSDDAFKKRVSFYLSEEIKTGVEQKPIERTALKTYTFLKGRSLEQMIEDSIIDLPLSVERNFGFIDELLDELPKRIKESSEELDAVLTDLIYKLVNRLNVHQFVEENLQRYDEVKLEKMIQNATNEQLKTIQYLGAVLGTIGGFVIWQPVLSLILLSLISASVYLADRSIYQ